MSSFTMSTDTATLAVFDPVHLAHRLADAGDWWSVPSMEIAEVNAGNMCLVGLRVDGFYAVTVLQGEVVSGPVAALVRCSGSLYVGPGEDIPGGGMRPDDPAYIGGKHLEVAPGTYLVTVSRRSSTELLVGLARRELDARNEFLSQLMLP